ncbi:MAG: hypothetical protein MJ237_09445 [bacterium]|nr:hypothetical protein [bacterium]
MKYKFKLVTGTLTRFVADVGYQDYPFPRYKIGVNIGKSYLAIRPSLFSSYQLKRFEYCVEFNNGKVLTGFNEQKNYKDFFYGNDKSLGLNNLVIIHSDLDSFVELDIIPRNEQSELTQFTEYMEKLKK